MFGGSWGSTLALAYAERCPNRVTEIILFGVTTGRRMEFDWLFRGGVAVLFPENWDLKRAWPGARLVIVDDAGHDASNAGITRELIRATNQVASR